MSDLSTAEILSYASYACFAIAAIALILAVILFIYYRIPKVIGELTGKSAQKSIKQIREGNEKSGEKSHRPSAVNKERGVLTETSAFAGEKDEEHELSNRIYYEGTDLPQTGLLQSNRADTSQPALKETSLLEDEEETSLLEREETSLLREGDVSESGRRVIRAREPGGIELEIIDEVMLIHTDEYIDD